MSSCQTKNLPKAGRFLILHPDESGDYDNFTCFRLRRRAFELAGRAPWLALLSLRFVFAMIRDPDIWRCSTAFDSTSICSASTLQTF